MLQLPTEDSKEISKIIHYRMGIVFVHFGQVTAPCSKLLEPLAPEMRWHRRFSSMRSTSTGAIVVESPKLDGQLNEQSHAGCKTG
jgi:hypothetical protein